MKSRPFRYRKCCRSATRTPPLNLAISARDYVDWHEVETVSVPKMLQECHKNPAAKLGDLSAVIKK
ncbi:HdeA/HdeB family chaperone [Klebsiella pneumoniae]|uniref:HdeA/HdeB family chaperone n=1 Tax=Klebsiella pneumoniae TaxID=573 RepID=UPI0039767656